MTSLDIIAILFAVLLLLKLGFVLIKPRSWMTSVILPLWKNPNFLTFLYLVLIIVVGYYVFLGVPASSVASVMLFTALLIGLAIIPYKKALLKEISMNLSGQKEILNRHWLSIIIWFAIAVWVLWSVFFR